MTHSEVLDLIATTEMMERTVRCSDVAHARHMQVGRLLAATSASKSDDLGCICYVGFASDPTNAGSPIPVKNERLVAEFLDARQIEVAQQIQTAV